jgi:UDP-N-acetylmuramoylalanine--D-glutamate ligase
MTASWSGKRVAVVGLARSGVAACRFLFKRGARVLGVDLRGASELGSAAIELQKAGIETFLGGYPDLSAFDAIVLSPGVDPAQEAIARAVARGVSLWPELELGAKDVRGRIVCITGTKGKSTTTTALRAMLVAAGFDARAVGNIGDPITAHVDDSDERTIFVTEASSFQLETTREFRPGVAVFLNLFPDHLDRHPTFEAYAEAKARIFANQTADDTAIVNGDDSKVLKLAERTKAKVIHFRPRTAIHGTEPQSGFAGDLAVFERPAGTVDLFHSDDVRIPGAAVRTNLLAAATAASVLGAGSDAIRSAVRSFSGVAHTFERIGELNGVAFFNDSKATTLDSVRVALSSFETPVIAIMGGRLKAGSFESLRETVAHGVRSIYAIGESRGLVVSAFEGICPVHEADTLEDAARRAYRESRPGDTILLSPGCSSFDMFRDYADRGETFRRAFRDLSLQGAA